MDQLESLKVFTRVVDAGGFAAAARELGLSRSVVNRAVIALEQRLGVQLLQRSTRQVSPTAQGVLFYERCRPLLEQLDDAFGAVVELKDAPSGTLRINAPMSLGTLQLAEIAARFMAEYPDIRLELALTDRQVDPLEEGFDVTLRVGDTVHRTSLIEQQLATVRIVLCASPAYLKAAGEPRSPLALRTHRCLHYGYLASGSQWRFRALDGTEQRVDINCVMWSNNGEVLRDAALADQGLALLPTFIVGPAIEAGALRVVLPAHERAPVPLAALFPRHRNQSRKVRLFVDFAAERLQHALTTAEN